MKVTLINEPNKKLNAFQQVLVNRGIEPNNLDKYLKSSIEEDINPPSAFGEDKIAAGVAMLFKHIQAEDDMLVVVDADCDGYTSAALLINYLYDISPSFVENHLHWYIHKNKQHGLSDCIDEAMKYTFVIIPDAGSNDYAYHAQLKANGTDTLILDHHHAERISDDALIINNQLSDYPNKELSGVGITWQFCRAIDEIKNTSYAMNYLDLVATGLMGDMMSMLSIETKTLMFEGFKEENVHNPFIFGMIEKNNFALNKADYKPSNLNHLCVSPMGAAFFIVPFINAMVRSGTMEEKKLIFNSMLKFKAFDMIPSNKRGHKIGEEERLVDQAIRTCTNVKNRQTRVQDAGMAALESLIKDNNLLDHKVILFLLEGGKVDKNVAGLVANKIMAHYQRPVAVLTRGTDERGRTVYQGSARGYGKEMDFKQICSDAGAVYAEGHPGAFGLCLAEDSIGSFIKSTDLALRDLSSEPAFFVDYIWNAEHIDTEKIIEIASMNDYWGKDLDRSYVYIKNIKVTPDNFKVMKANTLKYSLPFVDAIQFSGSDEQIEKFSCGIHYINAVCKCSLNEWNFEINPQLIIEEFEEVEKEIEPADILTGWGF